ncbi:MAG TPA: Omp28-related outer membrane protein [Chitinophagales bacterium]|nr:MAG: hypothetical protein BGO32_04895 [Bacteroidetes bacterium 37-13]HRN93311.1 Omp28-related outer membrane protein [Chitinophagales bacterium]HRP39733.1 Omp28-related outer membrane protein [Chitinophagales bacterium]
MKNVVGSLFWLNVIFAFTMLFSCKEVGPNINLGSKSKALVDTTYLETPQTPEDKNVVMEEFTGVQCVNCPAGHQIIKTLKASYGERLVVISYHTDFLGDPFSFTTEDLRTEAAKQVQDYLVFDGYKPAASIDRFAFNSSQTSLLYTRNTWSNRVQQELTKTSPVNILLSSMVDSASRKLTATVELNYTSTITDAQKITLVIIENNIVEPQLNTGNVIDTFYTHNDIQRVFLTNALGDEITTTTEAGRVVKKMYQTDLPPTLNLNNLKLVAFVHKFSGTKEILQGKEIDAK